MARVSRLSLLHVFFQEVLIFVYDLFASVGVCNGCPGNVFTLLLLHVYCPIFLMLTIHSQLLM